MHCCTTRLDCCTTGCIFRTHFPSMRNADSSTFSGTGRFDRISILRAYRFVPVCVRVRACACALIHGSARQQLLLEVLPNLKGQIGRDLLRSQVKLCSRHGANMMCNAIRFMILTTPLTRWLERKGRPCQAGKDLLRRAARQGEAAGWFCAREATGHGIPAARPSSR